MLSQPRLSGGSFRWVHAWPAALMVQGGGAVADSDVPDPAYERLKAQLRTMPVIEQAKGIVMAQERCGPEEAFDLLRRASQRTNIKVYVLSAQIVAHVASGKRYDNVTPITLGGARSGGRKKRAAKRRMVRERRA